MTEARPRSRRPHDGPPTLGIFASIAHRYDVANRVTSLGLDTSWRRYAVRQLELPEDGAVLDIATGTADLAVATIRHAGAARVTATDVSEEMMEVGRAKVARLGLAGRVEFSFADAEHLPFADGAFDGVTVAFGVRNFADRPRAFEEIARVLKPGGRFVCLEFTTPTSALVRAAYRAYLATVVPAAGWLLTGDLDSYRYLSSSIRAFPSAKALADMLMEAGFTRVTYRRLTLGVVAVHVATA